MHSWEDDRSAVVKKIVGQTAPLKIVLKLKNDSFFLPMWVEHHAKIVGIENLIVFDNMSDDEKVIDYYERHPELFVVRFSGHHNRIHDTAKFPELYGALRASCEYFSFLDADEMLILLSGKRYSKGSSILDFLKATDMNVMPTIWIYNSVGQRNVFICGQNDTRLVNGLKYGKPIISSRCNVKGFINHNCQLPPENIKLSGPLRLFTLHLTRLSPKQRVKVNVEKLISRGFVPKGASVEEILAKSTDNVRDGNIIAYVGEIRSLITAQESPVPNAELPKECFRLEDNHTVSYFSEVESAMVNVFINSWQDAQTILRSGYSPIVLPPD